MNNFVTHLTEEKIYHGDLIVLNDSQKWVTASTLKYTLSSPELKDCFVALQTSDEGTNCLAVPLSKGNDLIFNIEEGSKRE